MEMHKLEKLLERNLYLNLSTVSKNGQPWGSPLFFVYDPISKFIYWWSPKNSEHSKNLKLNKRCFITIFDSQDREGEGFGLYFAAQAQEIDSAQGIEQGIKLYNQKAKTFKLSLSDCCSDFPTRLYKAKIIDSWINSDNYDQNGKFYDDRKQIKL
ncbi:MAG TPA: pyridoxamine 5'-phosphate oxidase family protein [Candidatus Saccharibacteria bacterium]|jgi:general stress protein 26|nr:pyridoxamine 5'-phosphate oxidase family protein [Candidatus Saccharibacteria bacterium]